MRDLTELTSTTDPAWPLIQQWLADAPHVEVLPANREKAAAALLAMQVTLRSAMGAVVYNSGGLLIHHGWLRMLGSGHDRMQRSVPGWNEGRAPLDESGRPAFLLVADDVLGGLFAVNGGALGDALGDVFYLAPDTLQWESLSIGFSDFLAWALSPRLDDFYRDWRWLGWEQEVATLSGDQALSVYPFLWAAGPSIAERSRKIVPMEELFELTLDLQRQMAQ